MATRMKAKPAESAETNTENADAPLIESTGAALKKLVQKGKEKGYVTYDELNAALPSEEVSSAPYSGLTYSFTSASSGLTPALVLMVKKRKIL